VESGRIVANLPQLQVSEFCPFSAEVLGLNSVLRGPRWCGADVERTAGCRGGSACNAQRYERSDARRDIRAGLYEPKLQTKAGESSDTEASDADIRDRHH
jgi:hypothetical protein